MMRAELSYALTDSSGGEAEGVLLVAWRVNVSVCALTSASESQHFPCGVDECKRVAVGSWKAEL